MMILAVDLGQSKSVFGKLDTGTGKVRFGRFPTSDRQFQRLFARERPDRVVIEICPLAGRVSDLAQRLEIEIQVADTTQDAWKWKNVKRKTDRDDALKLARLSALGQLNLVHVPTPAMRQWRRLVEQRRTLVGERTRCKNRIRAILLQEGQRLAGGKKGWTLKALEGLRQLTQPLAKCEMTELWRGMLEIELRRLEALIELLAEIDAQLDKLAHADRRTVLVETMPGVGFRTAEAIVTVLDDPRRFKTRRQLAAYAGLIPRCYQSGEMARQGRITKRGNRLLRGALNQAAWSAVRYSPRFREIFLRVSGGRKARKKQAIVAVMHKLLIVAWAIMRDGQRYRVAGPARAAAAA